QREDRESLEAPSWDIEAIDGAQRRFCQSGSEIAKANRQLLSRNCVAPSSTDLQPAECLGGKQSSSCINLLRRNSKRENRTSTTTAGSQATQKLIHMCSARPVLCQVCLLLLSRRICISAQL